MTFLSNDKPLTGIKILDLGIITAGAATSALLGDMGAEVIKLESPTYRDPFRIWVALSTEDQEKLSPHFSATNRGKKSLAINLKDDAGRQCFLDLVRQADVVIENFRRGVLANLGIDFEQLRAVNPRIVLASVSSQGESGPDARQVSYGSTLECVAGMAWHLGYDETRPMVSGVDLNYPDQVAAIFAAGMVVSALTSVRENGQAVHLDISQRELTSYMIGDLFAATDAPVQRGNAEQAFVLQDCFQAKDDRWLAVSITADDVPAFKAVTGLDGIEVSRFGAWVANRSVEAAAKALNEAGISAAPSLRGDEVLAREQWSSAMIPGTNGEIWKGTPYNLGYALAPKAAPEFGADTIEILETLGNLSGAEIAALLASGSIGAAGDTQSTKE